MNDLRINERITIPASQLQTRQVRSSGPGGQNVNKVATKVILTWAIDPSLLPSEAAASRLRRLAGSRLTQDDQLQITCQQTRSAERNQQLALLRLRDLILSALEKPKPRRPTKPSKGSVRRRLDAKSQRGEKKSSRQTRWEG